ncbi:hypothetical protein H0H92_006460 [Tricholoma furcatifolium]|nr:hypothetical protein H0H92_006460 [Tricholoma furcatifolium]
MFGLPFFVSALWITSLVDGVSAAGAPERRSRTGTRYDRSVKTWTQVDKFQGDDFLNGSWNFFDDADPTNGLVNYQNADDAKSKGLAVVTDGQLVLSVDDTTSLPPGGKRDSVRISTQKTYNGGLFIADFAAMPVGCSTWPAYWSVGPNWPAGGEIDVLEGVQNSDTNQYTLHTSAGCSSDSTISTTSKLLGTTCESSGSDNNGCAFKDTDTRSYGQGFNSIGGGVFAHLWDSDGIKIWHFARGEIPADITAGTPDPTSWPTPAAQFPQATCDISQHFYDHVLVIDTTLCGDWAGAAYPTSGCPGTCAEAVADPSNFTNAKWKVNYIATYQ